MRPVRVMLSMLIMVLMTSLTAAPAFADKDRAEKFVETLAKDVLAMIGKEDLTKQEKQKRLVAIFEAHVDIDWIAKFVLGKFWREATDEQKAKYIASYHKFLLMNYTSNFENFADSRFEMVKSQEGNSSDEYIVSMLLKRKNQEDISVDYRLKEAKNGKYKVIDIVAEGVSLLTSQRSEFTSVVSRNGLDYLIEQLDSKVTENAR